MENFWNNQLGLFIMYIAGGIIICLIFDIFRALRKSIKTPDIITYIQDTLFWIITGALLIYLTFVLNSGNIRLYSFLGLFLGGLLYYFTVSRYFIKGSVKLFTFLKDIFIKVFSFFIIPVKKIFKINKKIVYFICINLQNITNVVKKLSKFTKKEKKAVK